MSWVEVLKGNVAAAKAAKGAETTFSLRLSERRVSAAQ
jgi:hypothetical protein